MKVFSPGPLESAELCHPVKDDDFLTIAELLNGERRSSTWRPIEVKLVKENGGVELDESDAPWLEANALVFRRRAIEALTPMLQEYGELLPLACRQASLCAYNPTLVLDALDEDASSLVRMRSGKIAMVRKHVFKPEIILGKDVFKNTSVAGSPTFVSERFVSEWTTAHLRGLAFREVWAGPV